MAAPKSYCAFSVMWIPIEMPYDIYGKLIIMGFVLLCLLLAALVLATERITRGRWSARVAIILVLLAVTFIFVVYAGPHDHNEHYVAQAKEQAAQLIRRLDEYQRVHGKYPSSLNAAGIRAPRTPYGVIHYSIGCDIDRTDRTRYCLTIADYGKHGFLMAWDSQQRNSGWYFDS
jgi:hypothetical protein